MCIRDRGKHVIVPLVNREIPVIEDTYVDIEFGTGCLKVTPAPVSYTHLDVYKRQSMDLLSVSSPVMRKPD